SKSKHGKIALLTLDAVEKEMHHSAVEVTDSPVEQGVNISDHARPKPDEVTIEGWVTNHPLPPPGSAASFIPGLAENAYADLIDLHDNPRLITVVTSLRTYDDVIMVDLAVPRDAKTGESLHFTAQFKQIRSIQNQTVLVTRGEPKTKDVTDLSKKAGLPTDTATANKSLSKTVKDKLNGKPLTVQNITAALGLGN